MPSGAKPAPPGKSRRPDKQVHGWAHAPEGGWQHGKAPTAPSGMTAAGRKAWRTWFDSWFAAFWGPEDLPVLELAVRTYDGVLGGHIDIAKFIPIADRCGLTHKGRQDLRWAPPVGEVVDDTSDIADELDKRREKRRARLAAGS